MGRPEKIRLGEILVQQKLLTEDQLKAALDEQKKSGRRLGHVFIEKGFITEEQISKALARQLGAAYIDLKHYNIKRDVITRLPETQARRFRAIVLEDKGEVYMVGMADPTDLTAYDEIARVLKRDIDLAVVTETELLRVIDRSYRRTEQIVGLAQELGADLGDSGAVDLPRWRPRRGWKRRRSSNCCRPCSRMPPRRAPPTSTSNRRKNACRSVSASTACFTCRRRLTQKSPLPWCCD